MLISSLVSPTQIVKRGFSPLGNCREQAIFFSYGWGILTFCLPKKRRAPLRFEDEGDALAAADACRGEAPAFFASFEFEQHVQGDAGAGGSQGVT